MALKVLMAHNHYLIAGGEDESYRAEVRLLRANGHDVGEHVEDNQRVAELGSMQTAIRTTWSRETYHAVRKRVRDERFDVVYVQNFFPLISPAIYYAARDAGVPVVQTLRNYRLFCLNSLFLRDGRVCEDCFNKTVPWPGVLHRCYRGDRLASGAVAAMLTTHRALRTWLDTVDQYIVLTEFARQKFVAGGLPADKIAIKPNFVDPDPGMGSGQGVYALCVGRLSEEKGLDTLLAAWRRLPRNVPLKIVGDGPLAPMVAAAAAEIPHVEWLGKRTGSDVIALMRDAKFLVFPSVCYEGFPRVIAEAFAVGLPVLASDIGSMTSLIDHRRTGVHFRPGDVDGLVEAVAWAEQHADELAHMRLAARGEFEAKYTAERNYMLFSHIFEALVSRSARAVV